MTGDGLAARTQGAFVAAALSLGSFQSALAACVLPTASPDAVRAFIDSGLPALGQASSSGGQGMSFQIRTYAATTDDARKAIAGMVKQANLAQKAAIGRGLGLAFLECSGQSPGVGRKISDLARDIGDAEVTTNFGRQLADGYGADSQKSDSDAGDDRASRSSGGLGLDQLSDPTRPLPLPGAAPLGR